ncbi:MAG: DNA-processing protein DprA [Rikenellaceae bacterium]
MATLEDIALSMTSGLGTQGAAHLLEIFSSAEKIFSASYDELVHFAQMSPQVAKNIVDKSAFRLAEGELKYCAKNRVVPIASTDAEFPELLREIGDYPSVIYVSGNIDILSGRSVSMVGTRKMSPYGERACNSIVEEMSSRVPNLVITSGLAFGVDGAAHRAALSFDVPTIAVLPTTLPSITPTHHASLARDIVDSGGALISELNSQTKNNGKLYIARNRIIAAMSGATILVESPESGGSMVTAKMAADYNRVVGAVPGRITDPMSRGCNMLIRNKVAMAVTRGEDIIRELMWDCDSDVGERAKPQQTAKLELTRDEAGLLRCFREEEPLHVSQLVEVSGMQMGELAALLMGLELSGVVRMLPGNRYERLVSLDRI